ncbi:hypothetical protein ACMA5I_10940 [Paracoccaceae bacterium GXU_MW_L88]
MAGALESEFTYHILQGGCLTGVATGASGEFWISAWGGDVWCGVPHTGFRRATSEGVRQDFNAVGVFESEVFLAAPSGQTFLLNDGDLIFVETNDLKEHFTVMGFQNHGEILLAQGINGFALYDGIRWNYIEVPW